MGNTVIKLQALPPSYTDANQDKMYLIYLALHYSELKESFNALPRHLQLAYILEINSCYDDLGEAFASRDKEDF